MTFTEYISLSFWQLCKFFIANHVTLIRNWCVTAFSRLLFIVHITRAVTHPTKYFFYKRIKKTAESAAKSVRLGGFPHEQLFKTEGAEEEIQRIYAIYTEKRLIQPAKAGFANVAPLFQSEGFFDASDTFIH